MESNKPTKLRDHPKPPPVLPTAAIRLDTKDGVLLLDGDFSRTPSQKSVQLGGKIG